MSCFLGITGSYVDYTGTSTSTKSEVNMERSDSQGSNDTIKITPQFAPYFKPKVRPSFPVLWKPLSIVVYSK